jgi:hypothetical protein
VRGRISGAGETVKSIRVIGEESNNNRVRSYASEVDYEFEYDVAIVLYNMKIIYLQTTSCVAHA